MRKKRLVIGSRSSKLALIQTSFVKDRIQEAHPELDIKIKTIKTLGEKISDVPLSRIGSQGVFTKEIEEALLERGIDIAVHSMKDIPVKIPDGLKVACILKREKPNDVLVSRQAFTFKTLPKNAKVGTSSLRRSAQLLRIRGDLKILDLRGNLQTRIKKLNDRLFDAIILAYAGLKRLGYEPGAANRSGVSITEIPINDILPQAGQGALGVENRQDDPETDKIVKALNDKDAWSTIRTERAVLKTLEGGCRVPIGVYADIQKGRMNVRAGVFSLDGKGVVNGEITGDKEDVSLGTKLGAELLEKGARKILCQIQQSI